MTTQDEVSVPPLTTAQAVAVPQQRVDTVPELLLGNPCPPAPARFECCGVRIDALSPDEAVAELRRRAQLRQPTGVHLCNAYTLKLALDNRAYATVLNTGTVNLPDGAPVAWAARRAGHANVTTPVRGPGLLDAVLRDGLSWSAKHYFYGSTPEVIEQLAIRLPKRYRGIDIIGLESPPFRPLSEAERDATRERLAATGAHYLWIGLGTPKQDWFVSEFAAHIPAVTLAVGAAFEFAAGTQKEAPVALHGSGFEWLYRLASEPRRLAGRYLRTATTIPMIIRSCSDVTPPKGGGRTTIAGLAEEDRAEVTASQEARHAADGSATNPGIPVAEIPHIRRRRNSAQASSLRSSRARRPTS